MSFRPGFSPQAGYEVQGTPIAASRAAAVENSTVFSLFFPLLFTGLAVLPAAVPKEVIHCSQDTQCFPAHYGISTVKRERKRSTIHACNISKCETVWLYVLRHFEPNSVCEGV